MMIAKMAMMEFMLVAFLSNLMMMAKIMMMMSKMTMMEFMVFLSNFIMFDNQVIPFPLESHDDGDDVTLGGGIPVEPH